MCGICGFFGFEDPILLKKMCNSLLHRGPDDQGEFFGNKISLGHRRLSIIDLQGGHQPIHNEDESIWTIFNGEIYNYRELSEILIKLGHRFYTSSDTEVLVHAYEEFGLEFIKKLVGIFAFAIWDENKRLLILARDRLGVKPLYYSKIYNKLLFASEIKALLLYEEVQKELDFSVLPHFFTYQSTPNDKTIFKDIKKIPPGYILIASDKKEMLIKYWDVYDLSDFDSRDNLFNNFKILLQEAVKKELISDVPLGIFLSGGLDSSSIAALASRFVDTQLRTFSVGFGAPTDELNPAKEVAEFLGTNHHELIVESNTISKMLPKIVWFLDEPIADPAAIPIYLLSGLAKKYVSVVLTGEGADELFAGYPKYKLFSTYFHQIPNSWRYKLYSYSPPGNVFDDREKIKLENNNNILEWHKSQEGTSFKKYELNNLLKADMSYWLPNYLLMKVDKMTMSHGLEARVPFLDRNLVEFSCQLPDNLKLNGFKDKYILRKSMSNLLPNSVINRPKKGFPLPLNSWLSGDMNEYISQVLSDSTFLREYFNPGYINKIIKGYKMSYNPIKRFRYTRQAWLLLIFSLWYKMFIEDRATL